MKLLFITPQPPFPPKSGAAIRSANTILSLSRGHQITVFALRRSESRQITPTIDLHNVVVRSFPVSPRGVKKRAVDFMTKKLPDLALRLCSPALACATQELIERESIDIVQIEGLESAASLENVISRRDRPRIVYDAFNAEYQLQLRAFKTDLRNPSKSIAAFYSLAQWLRLASYERWLCSSVDAVTTVSEEDKNTILALSPGTKITVVPSGVDTNRYRPGQRDSNAGKNILFTGTMDYRPNIDAMRWFHKEIFPAVVQQVPDAQLWIAGRDPIPAIRGLAGPNITVTGEIEDDLPYFQRADVFVLPMRYGGGVRLKLLQAMACGLPIVSTPHGLEGVRVSDEKDVLVADSHREFAARVVQVLRTPQFAASIGANARKTADERYSWQKVLEPLEGLYQSLLMEQAK